MAAKKAKKAEKPAETIPAAMDDVEIAKIHKRLKDRGFIKEGKNAFHETCQLWSLAIYRLQHPRMGGRDIEWCMHCNTARSWRRPPGGARIEDAPFDLGAFLA